MIITNVIIDPVGNTATYTVQHDITNDLAVYNQRLLAGWTPTQAMAQLNADILQNGANQLATLAPSATVTAQAQATALQQFQAAQAAAAAANPNINIAGQLPPVITSALAASTTHGQPFNYAITATGSPTSFSTSSLPSGLTLDPIGGVISGTVKNAGIYPIKVSATNAAGIGQATVVTITAQ